MLRIAIRTSIAIIFFVNFFVVATVLVMAGKYYVIFNFMGCFVCAGALWWHEYESQY